MLEFIQNLGANTLIISGFFTVIGVSLAAIMRFYVGNKGNALKSSQLKLEQLKFLNELVHSDEWKRSNRAYVIEEAVYLYSGYRIPKKVLNVLATYKEQGNAFETYKQFRRILTVNSSLTRIIYKPGLFNIRNFSIRIMGGLVTNFVLLFVSVLLINIGYNILHDGFINPLATGFTAGLSIGLGLLLTLISLLGMRFALDLIGAKARIKKYLGAHVFE